MPTEQLSKLNNQMLESVAFDCACVGRTMKVACFRRHNCSKLYALSEVIPDPI